MNRHQRRRAKAKGQRVTGDSDLNVALGRADLLRIVARMVEADDTVSGATIITRDGKVSYVDAGQLRRGGRA